MLWVLNLMVAAILYGVAELAHFAGWQISLGYLIGFLACYFIYGCWRVDDRNENYRRFPPNERQARYERDRAIDPRL